MKPEEGSFVLLESFKHDGSFHRLWDKAFVLEADEDRFVLVTNQADVLEGSGHRWTTREPALYYLDSHNWYNVIAMFRENGIYYYVNLASPALYDGEAIKYIDYDLDYKIYPDATIIRMDENEYEHNRRVMKYPEEIQKIMEITLKEIPELYKKHEGYFNRELNEEQFHRFLHKI
ncbi:MAG: DUF402 domain-containing protein [Erysipelotrichaceae bacterium]|nr:DUF402 domain-containing protein [Erysipelotrichaceae bacterium]